MIHLKYRVINLAPEMSPQEIAETLNSAEHDGWLLVQVAGHFTGFQYIFSREEDDGT
jgi:hypothetical protein